jgi:hypothetical protein
METSSMDPASTPCTCTATCHRSVPIMRHVQPQRPRPHHVTKLRFKCNESPASTKTLQATKLHAVESPGRDGVQLPPLHGRHRKTLPPYLVPGSRDRLCGQPGGGFGGLWAVWGRCCCCVMRLWRCRLRSQDCWLTKTLPGFTEQSGCLVTPCVRLRAHHPLHLHMPTRLPAFSEAHRVIFTGAPGGRRSAHLRGTRGMCTPVGKTGAEGWVRV